MSGQVGAEHNRLGQERQGNVIQAAMQNTFRWNYIASTISRHRTKQIRSQKVTRELHQTVHSGQWHPQANKCSTHTPEDSPPQTAPPSGHHSPDRESAARRCPVRAGVSDRSGSVGCGPPRPGAAAAAAAAGAARTPTHTRCSRRPRQSQSLRDIEESESHRLIHAGLGVPVRVRV